MNAQCIISNAAPEGAWRSFIIDLQHGIRERIMQNLYALLISAMRYCAWPRSGHGQIASRRSSMVWAWWYRSGKGS
jgi:hypothetical protein